MPLLLPLQMSPLPALYPRQMPPLLHEGMTLIFLHSYLAMMFPTPCFWG